MRNPSKAAPLGLALDATGREPLHRQIGAELRRAILERRLAGGMKLPSSRLMAVELACARGTVLLALEQLIAEGYIVARPGSGMSVAADLPDEMLAAPAPAIQGAAEASGQRCGPVQMRRCGLGSRTGIFPSRFGPNCWKRSGGGRPGQSRACRIRSGIPGCARRLRTIWGRCAGFAATRRRWW